MAFYDLNDNMDLAEKFITQVLSEVLSNCVSDLEFLNDRQKKEDLSKPLSERNKMDLLDKIKFVVENNFTRITYNEAYRILKDSKPNKKKKFKFLINQWGTDLQSEHERYLVEKHFKRPVIIFNYYNIKAFYMRRNDDGKTVRAGYPFPWNWGNSWRFAKRRAS